MQKLYKNMNSSSLTYSGLVVSLVLFFFGKCFFRFYDFYDRSRFFFIFSFYVYKWQKKITCMDAMASYYMYDSIYVCLQHKISSTSSYSSSKANVYTLLGTRLKHKQRMLKQSFFKLHYFKCFYMFLFRSCLFVV